MPPLIMATTKRALANTKLVQNDMEGALKMLEAAEQTLETLPDSPATIRETGMIYQVKAKISIKQNNLAQAINLLGNALELLVIHGTSMQLSETWRLFGEIYLKQENFEFANEALNQCLILAEQNNNIIEIAHCKYIQGKVYVKLNDYIKAEELIKQVIETSSAHPTLLEELPMVQLDLVKIYSATSREDDAKSLLEDIEEIANARGEKDLLQKINDFKKDLF